MKPIRKILRYIKAEGLFKFIDTMSRELLILTGLKKSVTFFFKKEISYQEIKMDKYYVKHHHQDLVNNLPRIGLLFNHPVEEWEAKGCDVFCAYDKSEKPASYLVFHDKYFSLNSFSRFVCKENETFSSPSFVKKEYRGQRINHLHHNFAFNYLHEKKSINVAYACVRGNNYNSISSLLSLGYVFVGIVTFRMFFKKIQHFKISEVSGKSEIKDRVVLTK